MNNILNSIIVIEDYNGDEMMRFIVDEKGNIDITTNCDIADITDDYIYNTDKKVVRIQSDYINGEFDDEDDE